MRHFAYGENGCHFNNIPLSRVNVKIRDGSISEINQSCKSNIFTMLLIQSAKFDNI